MCAECGIGFAITSYFPTEKRVCPMMGMLIAFSRYESSGSERGRRPNLRSWRWPMVLPEGAPKDCEAQFYTVATESGTFSYGSR